jgi:repressor LexA
MLTERQKQILDYIVDFRRGQGCSPSIPEIQKEFGFRSPNAVQGHLLALESKGVIRRANRGSRQIDVVDTPGKENMPAAAFTLPLYGQIAAGPPQSFGAARAESYMSVDEVTLGFKPKSSCFGLRVRGDSMKDAGILEGDIVVVEPTPSPQANQIVVALIDGENTLKRLVHVKGKWFLKAENPAYPELHPRSDLVIQGVVRTVVRRLE